MTPINQHQKIYLLPGDVFCASDNKLISRLIRLAERFSSKDDSAHYGHSGIITSSYGVTLEALLTVRYSTIDAYVGHQIIVARPVILDTMGQGLARKEKAIVEVGKHVGQWYPFWRLVLHLVPPLAKYLSTGNNLVCSELVAKYLNLIGARTGPYSGMNPDDLADMFINWRNFDVLYEGGW